MCSTWRKCWFIKYKCGLTCKALTDPKLVVTISLDPYPLYTQFQVTSSIFFNKCHLISIMNFFNFHLISFTKAVTELYIPKMLDFSSFVLVYLMWFNFFFFFNSTGANKSSYAPEPLDVGFILQAEIISNGQKITVTTAGPIETGWCW